MTSRNPKVVDEDGQILENIAPVEDYEVSEEGQVERYDTRTAGTRFSRSMKDDDLAPLDFYIKVGHPMSPKVISGERKAGAFFIDEHSSLDEITIVPLGVANRRTYWNPATKPPHGEVLCKSLDGTKGEGNPGGYCSECKFRRDGCVESRVFEVFVKEWNRVCLWEMKGRAMNLARRIKTIEETDGPFGTWALRLHTQYINTKNGPTWDSVGNKVPLDFALPNLNLETSRPQLPF